MRHPNLPTAYANPITVPMEDRLIHWEDGPYCDDPDCPCHDITNDVETHNRYIGEPWENGFLTMSEAIRLRFNQQI